MPLIEPVKKGYRFKTKSEDWVYIGDPEDVEFHSKLKLERWGSECWTKLVFDDSKVKEKSCKCEKNKVKWETPDFDFHFYPVEPRTVMMKHPQTGEDISFLQNELGGLEFEIIFKKKPATNQISLAVETQGLKFYYQPLLHPDHPTWADTNDDGVADSFRPENVVGSYAVYHATRSNMHRSKADAEKYKTGKAFHIYRPKAKDSAGNEIWCDLHIDEAKGLLTVTIQQEFLDKAVYPVSVDPTFGYEEIGGSSSGLSADFIDGWRPHTCPENGTLESISIYGHGGATATRIKLGLYKDADDTLVDKTAEIDPPETAQWITGNVITGASLSNIDYIPCVFIGYNDLIVNWDDVTDYYRAYLFLFYNDFPDPISWTSKTMTNIRCASIYCTYTPVAYYLSNTGTDYTSLWELLTTAPATADDTTSVVAPKNQTGYMKVIPGTENTTMLDSLPTTFDKYGWRTEEKLNGTFELGDWTFYYTVVTGKYVPSNIRLQARLWKSANADGSEATALTDWIMFSAFTLASETVYNQTYTKPDLGPFTLSNEYLFVEYIFDVYVACGSSQGCSVTFRCNEGANQRIETTTFTPVAVGWKKLQYVTEPPTGGSFNKLKYVTEPPVANAWNMLAYEGE